MEAHRIRTLKEIHRPSQERKTNNQVQTLDKLHCEYSEIMLQMDREAPTVSYDIIDVFPLEVWIQIIKESLPSYGYTSALLLLTQVSEKWLRLLVSTPTLWSHVQICSSEEDEMAKAITSISLSQDAPIILTIYASHHQSIATVCVLLEETKHRVHDVTIALDIRQSNSQYTDIFFTLRCLLSIPELIPNVARIQLEHGLPSHISDEPTNQLIRTFRLPPSLRAILGWSFASADFREMQNGLQNFEEIESCRPIEEVFTDTISFSQLSRLHVTEGDPRFNKSEATYTKIISSFANLTEISYKNAYRNVFMDILSAIAPQILHLELRVPFMKTDSLQIILKRAVHLRTLCIILNNWHSNDEGMEFTTSATVPVHSIDHCVNIPTLQRLDLTVDDNTRQVVERPALRQLIKDFTTLYHGIRELALEFVPGLSRLLTSAVLEFISACQGLRRLRFNTYTPIFDIGSRDPFELRALEELDVGYTQLLKCLKAPNLHALTFAWPNSDGMQRFSGHRLQILSKGLQYQSTIRLSTSIYPAVLDLTLCFESAPDSYSVDGLRLTSLPFLTSITLIADPFTPHATELCLELLYHPSYCPFLYELKFPRWGPDLGLLFFMLEKRNSLATASISRIRRVTLPFIANSLRNPLALLLGGRFQKSLKDELFLGGSQWMLGDARVPGCRTCLLNSLGPCDEPVERGNFSYPTDADELNRMFRSILPTTFDIEVVKWLQNRDNQLDSVLEDYKSWASAHRRVALCDRRRWMDTPVEITEYDV